MKLASYHHAGQLCFGVVSDDGAHVRAFDLDAGTAANAALQWIDAAARGTRTDWRLRDLSVALGDVRLAAPIPRPRRNLFCVGRNYHAHATELAASVFRDNAKQIDQWPIVFTKVPECVVGPFDDVRLPSEVSTQIDYEAELCIVIGKGGRNITRAQALDHVFGYTAVNDVTARDVQMRHGQWDLGKSFDTFCPMGPWIVTADVFDPADARVRCKVNGELRQDGPVRQMIFDIAALIETCSRGISLFPGDLIATGTPAGVGMGMTPPTWLRHGDVVEVDIEGLGALRNTFVDPSRLGP